MTNASTLENMSPKGDRVFGTGFHSNVRYQLCRLVRNCGQVVRPEF